MDDLFGWRIIDCKPGIVGVVLSGCQGEEVEVRDVGIERVVEGEAFDMLDTIPEGVRECGCDYECYERCGVHSSLQIRRHTSGV